MKHYRVTAFFPEAPSPYAHQRILVSAGSLEVAIRRGLRALRRNGHLKGRHLRSVQVTATVDENAPKGSEIG